MCCAVASGGPWFNLFNLGGKSEAEMKKLKLNEIKNGRLAMLAVFGYGAQVRADGMTVLDTHTLDVGRDRTCVTGISSKLGAQHVIFKRQLQHGCLLMQQACVAPACCCCPLH
jgi:hypothetical protein